MIVGTTQADFAKLMRLRITEARFLLDIDDWDGAYYLAGYAVERAFKVRIIKRLMQSQGFPDRKLVEQFYKHDLKVLRAAAGLEVEMEADAAIKPLWETVRDWTEQSRYQLGKTEPEARDLYEAIDKGVLPWIQQRW